MKIAAATLERWTMLGLTVAFVVTRALGAWLFEPHNDEILWISLAQVMQRKWSEFATLPYDGRAYGTFNGPLPFWLNALTIGRLLNPLADCRLWSVAIATVGYLAAVRLSARLWGARLACLIGLFMLCSSHFFYFDALAMPEVFAYSLGMLFAERCEWATHGSWRRWLGVAAIGSLLCLTKETGLIFFPLALVFVIGRRERKVLGYFAAAVLVSFLVYRLVIPSTYEKVRHENMAKASAHNLVQPEERRALYHSGEFWRGQVGFLGGEIWWEDFGIASCVLLGWAIFQFLSAARRREKATVKRYLLMLTLLLLGFAPAAVLFKSHFPRHWGMGLWTWYAFLATILLVGNAQGRVLRVQRGLVGAVIVLALLNLAGNLRDLRGWRQTDYAILETSLGHFSGVGMQDLLRALAKRPPGPIIYDGSWSHPGVDVEVFFSGRRGWQLHSSRRLSAKQRATLIKGARQGKRVYFVFDGYSVERNPFFAEVVGALDLCRDRVTLARDYKEQSARNRDLYLCSSLP